MILGAIHHELRIRVASDRVEHYFGRRTNVGLRPDAVDVDRRDGTELERGGQAYEA